MIEAAMKLTAMRMLHNTIAQCHLDRTADRATHVRVTVNGRTLLAV